MKKKIVVYSYNGIILNNTRKQTMHATRWINLEMVMISEKGPSSHSPENIHHMIPFTENSRKCLLLFVNYGKGV